jgi:hypothetical protein
MARTWERACSRVRLGHVIRYIGLGRAVAKAPHKGPRRRSSCGRDPRQSPGGLLHSGKVNIYPASRPAALVTNSWPFCALEPAHERAEA